MTPQVLPKQSIIKWLESIQKEGTRVYAVSQKSQTHFLFEPFYGQEDPGEAYLPSYVTPLQYVLPPRECLLRFNRKTKSVQPQISAPKQLLFGVRPCDLTAIWLLDQIFAEETADPYYMARRKNLTLVGIDCKQPCPDGLCFCESVDSLQLRPGYDIFLSEINGAYYAVCGTGKGEDLLKRSPGVRAVQEADQRAYSKFQETKGKSFKYQFTIDRASIPLLFKNADAHPLWKELDKIDLGCGTCNLCCPTCYCFDIEDCVGLKLAEGERDRLWDGCTLRVFSEVAGGIVFRQSKGERLRHRFNRKFNYLMRKYGVSNCVGCGRCTRQCLLHISPRDVVNRLAADQKAGMAAGGTP